MPWAVAGAVIGVAGSQAAAKKQAAGQKKALATSQANRTENNAMTANSRMRGDQAGNRLQMYMGLSGGENVTDEQLTADLMKNFVTYTKIKKKKGSKFSQAKKFGKDVAKASLQGAISGGELSGGKDSMAAYKALQKRKYTMNVDYAGLKAAVAKKQAEYKAIRDDSRYGNLMKDFTGKDLENEAGYQFRKEEGARGVEGSAAARGGSLGGAALKELARYNQGFASNEFGAAFNRDASNKGRKYNFLSGISGTGQAATNQTMDFNNASTQQAMGQQNAIGATGASAAMGLTNAVQGGMEGYANRQSQNNMMQRYNQTSGGGTNALVGGGNNLSLSSQYNKPASQFNFSSGYK